MELWANKGTEKKYFLNLSTQIGFGAHTVSYSMAVWGSYPDGKVAEKGSYQVTDIYSRS